VSVRKRSPEAQEIMPNRRRRRRNWHHPQAKPVQDHAREVAETPDGVEGSAPTLAREELGIDPNELGGSALRRGHVVHSCAVGAIIPVLPFLVLSGCAVIGGWLRAAGNLARRGDHHPDSRASGRQGCGRSASGSGLRRSRS
jgi:hypothetical protein